MGIINWQKTASSIHNLVRGLVPWPGTHTSFRGAPLKIIKTSLLVPEEALAKAHLTANEPGLLVDLSKKQLFVKCGAQGNELVQVVMLQPSNKGKMSTENWLNGVRIAHADRFGI